MTEDSRGREKVVLIVDDEPNVLYFVKQLCRRVGLGVLTAQSGMEALKYVQEQGPQLSGVVLDLYMPGMGGIEVLKSIRKHQPDLPIIILSALVEKREECLRLGAEAFVEKPYSLEELERVIEMIIERHQFEADDDSGLEKGFMPCAKILIVDDEQEVCDLVSECLREASGAAYEVEYALNGDDALRKVPVFMPDIAIVDIKMPFMWGDELIDVLKANKHTCPKDFIIYTSTTEAGHVARAKKHTHKFLTKPVDIDVMLRILKKICVKHNLVKKSA